jgi:protein transport protein SEC24
MRSAALNLLSTLPPAFLVPYLYPRLYAIHEMTAEMGLPDADGIVMPPAMNLSSALFKTHGLYLIDDGQVQFLWVGRDAVPELIQDVFGLPALELVKPGKVWSFLHKANKLTTLPLLDNDFSPRVNAVITKSRAMLSGSLYYPHLYVVKEDGDPGLRIWAASTLVEDRSDQAASYPQFLQQLRDRV